MPEPKASNLGDLWLRRMFTHGYKAILLSDGAEITNTPESWDRWHREQVETGCAVPAHLSQKIEKENQNVEV